MRCFYFCSDLELTLTFTILALCDNKEFLLVKDAAHSDLYDGGINHDKIPFDKIEEFIKKISKIDYAFQRL